MKNLTWQPGTPPLPAPVNILVGKTKLAGTQVIDADYILGLIDSKITSSNGVQTVDSETLRIIYQQIQELSNMGDNEQAQLLKEFVDTELVPGNLSSGMNFDEAFEIWKAKQMQKAVNDFSSEWGLDSKLLEKSVSSYSTSLPDAVPYINELISSIDFEKAKNQTAGNRLRHIMILTEKLPNLIAEVRQRYN
ncbi:type I restriction endonuclease subunit R, EcoR124 family [Fictibacillus enclensis]|uniref:type I restriction endonuclease subunit R, EcoR124 family n=1 Tax=Fictibacillus enclensis TaxID=1017270 RepID=UPI0030B82D15